MARSGWGVVPPGGIQRWGTPCPGMGYTPPPQDRTVEGVHDTHWAVCLLALTQEDFLVFSKLVTIKPLSHPRRPESPLQKQLGRGGG